MVVFNPFAIGIGVLGELVFTFITLVKRSPVSVIADPVSGTPVLLAVIENCFEFSSKNTFTPESALILLMTSCNVSPSLIV